MLGLPGIAVFIGAAWAMSDHRKAIRWRTVSLALAIQIGIGTVVFGIPQGREALAWLSARVTDAIGAGKTGVDFLFGPLTMDGGGIGFVFALRVLPAIIFFSSLIAVLYHLGLMQRVIRLIGGALRKLPGTSKAESMSAAAMGVEMKYLLAASFMAAPGGLLFAKLMKPEIDNPREGDMPFADGDDKPANVLDAAALGAATGLKFALNVGANQSGLA